MDRPVLGTGIQRAHHKKPVPQNNISIHTYNYWKHAVKEVYVDSILPDIVPIAPVPLPAFSTNPSCSQQLESRDSLNSCNSPEPDCVSIVIGDIRIEIDPSASNEIVSRIIKAVRHV